MRRYALLATVAILGMIAACSNPPTTGVVVNKRYIPSYMTYDSVCVSYDKHGFCQQRMPFPHTVPEEWQLCLRADAGDTQHDKTGCFDTDPQTWHQYAVGSHFPEAR